MAKNSTAPAMQPRTREDIEREWTAIAQAQLLNRKIVAVRYMTIKEMEDLGWFCRAVICQLDDGNIFYPSCDDEGNNAGALFTNNKRHGTLPVL